MGNRVGFEIVLTNLQEELRLVDDERRDEPSDVAVGDRDAEHSQHDEAEAT